MARDLAIVAGFCGSNWSSLRLTASEIGEHPVACAPKNFTFFSSTSPTAINSENDLRIFVISEPPAMGTTILSGRRQPSCSAIS